MSWRNQRHTDIMTPCLCTCRNCLVPPRYHGHLNAMVSPGPLPVSLGLHSRKTSMDTIKLQVVNQTKTLYGHNQTVGRHCRVKPPSTRDATALGRVRAKRTAKARPKQRRTVERDASAPRPGKRTAQKCLLLSLPDTQCTAILSQQASPGSVLPTATLNAPAAPIPPPVLVVAAKPAPAPKPPPPSSPPPESRPTESSTTLPGIYALPFLPSFNLASHQKKGGDVPSDGPTPMVTGASPALQTTGSHISSSGGQDSSGSVLPVCRGKRTGLQPGINHVTSRHACS